MNPRHRTGRRCATRRGSGDPGDGPVPGVADAEERGALVIEPRECVDEPSYRCEGGLNNLNPRKAIRS